MTVPSPARVALNDQIDAAIGDATHQVDQMQLLSSGSSVSEDPWLNDQIAALRRAVETGTVRCCEHLATGPAVAYAALWRPGALACPQCLDTLEPDPGEDHICDRCNRHTPEIDTAVIRLGFVLVTFGACPPCARALGAPEIA
ncbi:hypothetical protein [Actinomadura oligospora]|uniref:hypothetical protein n=1 Tax=Actinomadura oligospora TaxID=111804 RepID=UPI000478DCC8|nr:hypothetical protein [Actinomadura oligospora]